MKKNLALLGIIFAMFLLAIPELDARGGRGGGGGGRGGGGRGGSMGRGGGSFHGGGGRSMNRGGGSRVQARSRSPSMSRPANRPNVSRPANRPNVSRDRGQGNRNIQGRRDNISNPTRNDVQNFLKSNASSRQQIGNRTPNRTQNADRLAKRRDLADNIRRDVDRDRLGRNDWFNDNFFDRHDIRPPYYNNRANWWGLATAAGISGWLGWNAAPYYYDYDDGTFSGYYGDSSSADEGTANYYIYSEPGTTEAPLPVPSTTPIATTDTSSADWMPLGVFALSKQGNADVTPNFYLQLALNKNGSLSGTFYNSTTNQTHEVEGMVDKENQTAAWKIADNANSPVMQTGLYNLTQSEAPAQVHFSDGRSETIAMVRLQK